MRRPMPPPRYALSLFTAAVQSLAAVQTCWRRACRPSSRAPPVIASTWRLTGAAYTFAATYSSTSTLPEAEGRALCLAAGICAALGLDATCRPAVPEQDAGAGRLAGRPRRPDAGGRGRSAAPCVGLRPFRGPPLPPACPRSSLPFCARLFARAGTCPHAAMRPMPAARPHHTRLGDPCDL